MNVRIIKNSIRNIAMKTEKNINVTLFAILRCCHFNVIKILKLVSKFSYNNDNVKTYILNNIAFIPFTFLKRRSLDIQGLSYKRKFV